MNELLPNRDLSVELDDLTAEYADEASVSEAPVKAQRSAERGLTEGALAPLPNPYAALQTNGAAPAPEIESLYPPEQGHDGTRLFVEVRPVAGATRYKGYVAAHSDGRGAQAVGIDRQTPHRRASMVTKPGQLLFDGLRPAIPMYLFVTAVDAEGRESMPSAIRKVVLRDEFPFQ